MIQRAMIINLNTETVATGGEHYDILEAYGWGLDDVLAFYSWRVGGYELDCIYDLFKAMTEEEANKKAKQIYENALQSN
ncbi:MAG: hypothetical protein ACRCX8_14235 [Sarcina sp.]